MAKDKLTPTERADVEHARRFAEQNPTGTPAIFADTYRKLVAVIDRFAPSK